MKKMLDNDSLNEYVRKEKKFRFNWLIVFLVVLSSVGCFAMEDIVQKIVMGIATVFFVGAFIIGITKRTTVKARVRICCAILGIILLIAHSPITEFAQEKVYERIGTPDYRNWSTLRISNLIPESPTKLVKNEFAFDKSMLITFYGVDFQDFGLYTTACEDIGFTVEPETKPNYFMAYNNEGYRLTLDYYDNKKLIKVNVEEPMDMGNYQWTNSNLVTNLPVPDSKIGNIINDSETSFTLYVGEMSKEQYALYVQKCMNVGYKVDFDRGDTFYTAKDEEGNTLTVRYEGNSIVYISLDKVVSEPTPTVTPTVTPVKTATPTNTVTNATDNVESTVTPVDGSGEVDFKACMDEYEKFFDEYIAFMNEYNNSDNVVKLVLDYARFTKRYDETMTALEAIEEDKLSASDHKYYITVMGRINQKLKNSILE